MLAISVAFAASGVASAQPWAEAAPPADSMELSTTSSLAGATTTRWTAVGARGVEAPDVDGPVVDAPPMGDRPVSGPTTSPVDVDVVPEGDLARNHGDFVSDQAHASAGTGAGCDVSTVARSDLGKKDEGRGTPEENAVGACEDDGAPAPSDDATASSEKKPEKDPGVNGKAKGHDTTTDPGGDE
jgi:hypothetical protein